MFCMLRFFPGEALEDMLARLFSVTVPLQKVAVTLNICFFPDPDVDSLDDSLSFGN